MSAMFDTLKAAKALREHGFTEAQSESLTEVLKEAHGDANLATKQDLEQLRAEMWKAISAQSIVLIGVMVALKLFG